MNKNSKKELLADALAFMQLRMELFKDRPSAADALLIDEETVAKYERAERRIDRRAWRDLRQIKEDRERAAKHNRRATQSSTIQVELSRK